jgi:hypothetical protein
MGYWKVFCEETEFPRLWSRWFRDQCAAVGWDLLHLGGESNR